jgi:rubrerythrin
MLEDVTIKKALEFAMKTEELGNIFYTKMAKKFENEEIADIFSKLAKDELVHQKQFEQLAETVPEDPNISSKDERLALLRIMSRSEFFMGKDGLYRKIEEIQTREDALERAVGLEKDTLGYFQAIKDVLGDDEVLNAIIKIEKSHLVKLMEYMITGAKMRGLGDKYPAK